MICLLNYYIAIKNTFEEYLVKKEKRSQLTSAHTEFYTHDQNFVLKIVTLQTSICVSPSTYCHIHTFTLTMNYWFPLN